MKNDFAFSVVTAVYNAAPFLGETVESLLKQDFGFSHVQLILVDDGSTDGSGDLCDAYAKRYPKNVEVIHKENGGVSSARNEGLKRVRGRYVSFLDADDLLSETALSKVFAFFEAHPETDVVSLPMEFFDGAKGPHLLNFKYRNGSRVIDLRSEPFHPQLAVTSAFVRASALAGKAFDTGLSYAEDAKFLQSVLIEKQTLGVVADAVHLYRRRSTGELSAIQNSGNSKAWYLPYLKRFCKETFDACKARFGDIPRFVQNTVAYDLQWRVQRVNLPSAVLSEAEKREYTDLFFSLVKRIDDDILARQSELEPYLRAFLLYQKHGSAPERTAATSVGQMFRYPGSKPFSLEFDPLYCDFFSIRDGIVTVECMTPAVYGFDAAPPVIVAEANGAEYVGEPADRKHDLLSTGIPAARRIGYTFRIPLPNDPKQALRIRFVRRTAEGDYPYPEPALNPFFPVSERYENAYAKIGDRVLQNRKEWLIVRKAKGRCLKYELKFQKELFRNRYASDRNALIGRIAYTLLKPLCRKPIWLVSDRMEAAGDNGEALFRYLCALKKKPARIYFAVSERSPAFAELKKIGKVVNARSAKHKILFLLCDMNISSQADDDIITQFSHYDFAYRDIQNRIRFVFLQHGVIKDDLSEWLNRYNRNAAAFVTSAKAEADSIRNGAYHYPDEAIWLTGLPRFDRLYHDEKRCITIMPTWRQMWVARSNTVTGVRELKDGFEQGAFFRFYNALLNDPRLLDAAKRTGCAIRFMPHPLLQPHMGRFTRNDSVTFLPSDTPYRRVFAESDLILTDYSSVVFDFVYLRKPVVYTQFDREEFYSGEHVYGKGYFDYERDGFGEVETDYEATVDRLIEYMENGFRLKDEYRARIDGFFAFSDRENCRRVTEKILALEAEQKRK